MDFGSYQIEFKLTMLFDDTYQIPPLLALNWLEVLKKPF